MMMSDVVGVSGGVKKRRSVPDFCKDSEETVLACWKKDLNVHLPVCSLSLE